jgi:hypothetical protein
VARLDEVCVQEHSYNRVVEYYRVPFYDCYVNLGDPNCRVASGRYPVRQALI